MEAILKTGQGETGGLGDMVNGGMVSHSSRLQVAMSFEGNL
jgi:hypothetical protein